MTNPSNAFPTEDDLKLQTSEYAVRKVIGIDGGFNLNVTYHFLVYTDDFYLFGGNINIIIKNT
jgi:hypothetical protein